MSEHTKDPSISELIIEGIEAGVPGGKGFGAEHLRAVRLADAAPDLLAACKRSRDFMVRVVKSKLGESLLTVGDIETVNLLDAALAKAK